MPKAPDERPINEENLLSLCKITFKFLNEDLKYTHYYLENKLSNKMEVLECVESCCCSTVTFNAIKGFQKGQEYHGPELW